MPIVILDTNVFIAQNFSMEGSQFESLSSLIPRGFKLKVPWVVLEETVDKFRAALLEQASKYSVVCDNLNEILFLSNQHKDIHRTINLPKEVEKYREYFMAIIQLTKNTPCPILRLEDRQP